MTNLITQEKGIGGLKLLDFPVEKAPIYLALGKEIPGQKAVVRPDNGQVLGILSDSYKLVSYKQQYEPYLEKLDREGWKVNSVRLERQGARAYVELDHTSTNTVKVFAVCDPFRAKVPHSLDCVVIMVRFFDG
jgi:hypothetical protein